MASGEGETLDAFASLMDVSEDDKADFYELTRTNFTTLFADDEVTAGEMLVSLNQLLAEDENLSVYAQS
jgi:hypothetical protein